MSRNYVTRKYACTCASPFCGFLGVGAIRPQFRHGVGGSIRANRRTHNGSNPSRSTPDRRPSHLSGSRAILRAKSLFWTSQKRTAKKWGIPKSHIHVATRPSYQIHNNPTGDPNHPQACKQWCADAYNCHSPRRQRDNNRRINFHRQRPRSPIAIPENKNAPRHPRSGIAWSARRMAATLIFAKPRLVISPMEFVTPVSRILL